MYWLIISTTFFVGGQTVNDDQFVDMPTEKRCLEMKTWLEGKYPYQVKMGTKTFQCIKK